MTDVTTTSLQECIARYQSIFPDLNALSKRTETKSLNDLTDCYDQCYRCIEKALWSNSNDFKELLNCYQTLFREQETLMQQSAVDRYHFIISVPVADRPLHLRAVLESICQVCNLYGYGGQTNGVYEYIKIIVAEDSKDKNNIQRHLDLIEEYKQKGLRVFHFNQDEQYEMLQNIPESQRQHLGNLLTTQDKDHFYLKGQAANRNLSYLKCLQLTDDKTKTLYYMIDSDQSFCVNRQTESGEEVVYALNYFYYIDKLFRNTDTLILTGKMVGDPPVSPSVMAANFLDDVTAFFTTLSQTKPKQDCQFHNYPIQQIGDAAYHDLAKLFGFDNTFDTYPYHCQVEGKHDHHACFIGFTKRLNAFFFGEHLTRKTTFSYDNGFEQLSPARTIYPGNYVVNYEGLKYIIPFGHLRLRMSGPTAGRLIAAEIKQRFASFNMPNLHRRTTEEGLNDDFRPGVELEDEQQNIDLSDEFERQFFGDLILFSTEELVKQADVSQPFAKKLVQEIVDKKETELLELYQQKHYAVLERNNKLRKLVFNSQHWWLDIPDVTGALNQVRTFIHNIEHNFGEHSLAYKQIQSEQHRAQRKQQIIDALMNYRTERNAWDNLFGSLWIPDCFALHCGLAGSVGCGERGIP